jgi:(p)ppGpp synthase/HD superfamily hydrolase
MSREFWESLENDISKAILYASIHHADQYDLQGNPYIFHPMRVMLGAPDHLKVPALLHDILEDTNMSYQSLLTHFGKRNAEIVQILTHVPNEPREEYIDRILNDPDAVAIKLLDIHDNESRINGLGDKELEDRLTKKYERDLDQIFSQKERWLK